MNDTVRSDQGLSVHDSLQIVGFRLGTEEYAIEITKAKEIILVEGVTRVPQMPTWIEGIINLRGTVVPVVDLRKRFGLERKESDQERIVVVRMDGREVGLMVDAVSQVLRIPNADIQPPPDTIAGLAGDYLIGIGITGGRMFILLDIEKILTAEEVGALSVQDHPTPVASAGEG